ncbi:DNA-3-methyladenine glycosylase [Hymenobacter sp. BT186]|uniref:Putative 3-methyladenine DNA glycosylase n=1 Tax=Hymenobacter telluris TaxID=2816474 RepID=A0A939JCA9_9BACT|nr:DNA-3-methyladenine glycosylase [Hymenobacter telluris]MBO0357117.1 DNA-3-methyladenine glycosylase [Hymenobacter telluris]MBW3373144.1 DNA-3-methyladenine glycosylase [Hymenobacter norwichensis]
MKLPAAFYQRPDPVQIARDLLGKHVFSCLDGQLTGGRIVETEAYAHLGDQSMDMHLKRRGTHGHALREIGGRAYLYQVYQRHTLFNISTNAADKTDTVLIRAIEPLVGLEVMLERRGLTEASPKLTAGPGVLTQALGLTPALTGTDLQGDTLWIEDYGEEVPEEQVRRSARVGLAYAGAEAANLPWRFRIINNKWTSPAK